MPQHYYGGELPPNVNRPPFEGEYGIGSPVWDREWDRYINARRAMVESMMARSHAQAALPGEDPDAPPDPGDPTPTDIAAGLEPGALRRMIDTLSRVTGPVGEWARRMETVAAARKEEFKTGVAVSPEDMLASEVPEGIRRRDWIHLLGQARFHQIPNAEKIPPDKLRIIIAARQRGMRNERLRAIMDEDPSLGGRAMEAIATAFGEFGTTTAKTWMDMAQNMPFVGNQLSRMRIMQDADIWLSSLQEGMRADLFEDELGGMRGAATGAAGFVAYALPAAAVYSRIAAFTGVSRAAGGAAGMHALPQTVNLLTRGSAMGGRRLLIAQHATAGAGTMWLLEGGGDAPLLERALMVAGGGGFGVLFGAGGKVAAGGVSAAVAGMGGLAVGAEPHEAALLAAAGGAVGVQTHISQQALAGVMRRVQQSFRSRIHDIVVSRSWEHPPGAPAQPRGPGRRTGVEGEDFWVDPSGGGGAPGGAAPGTALIPRPPAGGPSPVPSRHPQLRTPEGNRIQALERELGTARQARDLQARLANTDPLTGLGNYGALAAAARATPPGEGWIVFDARRFRDVNNTHGHAAGDEALQGFAAAIRQAGEEMGLHLPAFRQGGDEFATRASMELLPELNRRIRELSRQEFDGGITTWLDGAEGATIGEADAALLSLKAGSRSVMSEELPQATGQVEWVQSNLFDSPPLQRTPEGAIPLPGQTPATAITGVRVGNAELLWRGHTGDPRQPGLSPSEREWREQAYGGSGGLANWQPGRLRSEETLIIATPAGNTHFLVMPGGYRTTAVKGRPAGQDDELLYVAWAGMQGAGDPNQLGPAIMADVHRLLSELFPTQRYIGGYRFSGARVGPAMSRGPRYGETRLQRGGQAKQEASTLTKHNAILESPLVASMATQPTFSDGDVLRARAASHPGQVSLVRNVGDAAAAVREAVQAQVGQRLMPHQYRAVEMPDGSTDVLIADGANLSNQMVEDYRTHRVFKGMYATRQDGVPIVVAGRPYTTETTGRVMVEVRSLSDEVVWSEFLDNILPGVAGTHMILPRASSLMGRLRLETINYMRMESARAGIVAPGWLDSETTSQLPYLIERLLDRRSIVAPNQRAALTEYFHQQRLRDFRNATPPEDRAALATANAALRAAQREAGPDGRFSVEQAADAKHFTWLPDESGGGILADRVSDLRVPVDSREAAREWLANFARESPDRAVISDIPAEVWPMPVGAAQGATNAQFRDAEAFARAGEAGLATSRARQEIEAGVIEHEMQQLDQLLPPAGGGSGGPPPPPPPSAPPAGGGAELPGESFKAIGGATEALSRQFRGLRRTNINALNQISAFNDGPLNRFWSPIMAWAPRFDSFMRARGVESNLAADITAVGAGRHRAALEAQPFYNEASDIFNRFRTRHLTEGTLFEIMQIAPHMGQERAMVAARFNKREIEGVPLYRDLMNRLHEIAGYRPIGFIFDYMPHLMRLVNSNHPDPYGAWSNHLPEEHKWFARRMREGGVGAMERDPRVIMQTYIRGLFYEKHVAGPVGEIRGKWDHPDIPEGIKRPILGLMAREQLGYNPGYDSAVQGVRRMLNNVGIPVTDREVMMVYGIGFTNLYRAYLSTPFHLMRESVTLGLTASRVGFRYGGRAIKDWASSKEARIAMNERALEGGWGMAEAVRVPMAEMFQRQHGLVPEFIGGEATSSATAFGPKQQFVRKMAGKVTGAMRDVMPEGLRSGIGGTKVDPLYLYSALNVRERLLGGEMGWQRAHDAMEKYIAGEMPFRELMYKSGASLWEENTQREFARLVRDNKFKEAEFLLARKAADLQMRYGSIEQPFGMQEAGMVGKGFMGFGTFSNQLLWHFREATLGGRIPSDVLTPDDLLKLRPQDRTIRPDVASNTLGMLARYAAIMGAIRAAEITTGWDFGPWYWHRSFTFVGGPVIEGLLTGAQAARGAVRTVGGDYVPPEQRAAVNKVVGAPGSMPYNFFPYRGPTETLRGVDRALNSPHPVAQTFEQLVTGRQRAGTRMGESIERQMEEQRLSPTVPPSTLTSPGFGTINSPTPSRNIDSVSQLGVRDPSRVYEKSGNPVVDTPNRTADGKVPTHRVDVPSGRQPNETWEQYEQRVISTPESAYPESVRNVNRDLNALVPEARNRITAMIEAARREGVDLQVSETYRDPQRQEWLFRQGRATPGMPVTWTLTSEHAQRRAADLLSNNYEWIQQNASRFGLSVLGMFDPGHVFLPAEGGAQGGQAAAAGAGAQ